MIIVIDPHSGVPVYRQIVDQVHFQIVSGTLRSGDELPSTRALSGELGLNPMTVSKAYGYLEQEGVVERRPGLPLVVRELPAEELRTRKIEQFRDSLQSVVTVTRQLGIPKERAMEMFRDMLNGAWESWIRLGDQVDDDEIAGTGDQPAAPPAQ